MKSVFITLSAFAIFLAIFLPNVNAIKCYKCKSLQHRNCVMDMKGSMADIPQVDCDTEPKPNFLEGVMPVTKCNKVVTNDKAGVIVSRDCHFQAVGQNSDECMVSHSREVEKCFTCTGDLCNASNNLMAAVGLLSLLALTALHHLF